MLRLLIMGMLRAPELGGAGDAGGGASMGGGDSGGAGASSGSSSSSSSSGGRDAPRQVVPPGTNDSAASSAADEGGSDKPKADKPLTAAQKLKIKRFGKEVEYDADPVALSKMLDDDYEHEFVGPGGKPVKHRNAEIARYVQMGEGSLAKMREYGEGLKSLQQEREWGKQNIEAYLETRLGVEDARDFYLQRAREAYNDEQRLNQLMKQDPGGYHREMQKRAREKFERGQQLEKHRAESAQREQQQSQMTQRRTAAIHQALKDHGVVANDVTSQMAQKILEENLSAGYKIQPAELATLTKKSFDSMVHSYLDSFEGESALGFLGNDRRAKFREWEIAAAKGKKKEETAAHREEDRPQQRAKAEPRKQYTEAEIIKKFGSGGHSA
jgi:hypothetical protein